MGKFDFISGDDFRISLESDYQELESALKVGAYKAVHVLSGSIIEAILIDYLLAINYSNEDPLKMDLSKAISACKGTGVLSERTEHLSHVVRSYRNLIHPGRAIRRGETVEEDSAFIAYRLVNIIIKDISASREKTYGYTAEQIATKIVSDPSTPIIFGHILKNVAPFEKERLLHLIPQRYLKLMNSSESATLSSLVACFRLAFEDVDDEIKKKIAKDFIRILKEESSNVITSYESNFFRCTDLNYYSEEDVQLIKTRLVPGLKSIPIDTILLKGIGKYLSKEDVDTVLSPILGSCLTRPDFYQNFGEFLISEFAATTPPVKAHLMSRIHPLLENLEQGDQDGLEEGIEAIRDLLAKVKQSGAVSG